VFFRTKNPEGHCSWRGHLRRFWRGDAGQDLLEYALLVALIAFMATAALSPVAQVLNNGVDNIHKKFKKHVDHGLHKGWYK
jgi:Flp pilus assembly pilin Flp